MKRTSWIVRRFGNILFSSFDPSRDRLRGYGGPIVVRTLAPRIAFNYELHHNSHSFLPFLILSQLDVRGCFVSNPFQNFYSVAGLQLASHYCGYSMSVETITHGVCASKAITALPF